MTKNQNVRANLTLDDTEYRRGGVYQKEVTPAGTDFTLSDGTHLHSDFQKGSRVIWNDHPGTVEYIQLLEIDGRGDVSHAQVVFDEVGVWTKWVPDFELRPLATGSVLRGPKITG